MSTDDHAPFAPSGLHRTVGCPGSYQLINATREMGIALNEDETPESMEGTAAHHVVSHYLTTGYMMQVGELAPSGVPVTEEMIEGAEMFADAVRPYMEGARIEQHVMCNAIHHDCHGTPDFSYGPTNGTLFVSDYKFGYRDVDVFMNWQLLAYAIGTMPEYWPTMRVVLQIVQPRSFHRDGPVRTWVIDGDQLRAHVNVIREAVNAALLPDAKCTGGSHCYKCPVRNVCEAAAKAGNTLLDVAGSTLPIDSPNDVKALRLRQIRAGIKLLGEIESGLSEDLTTRIRRGEHVPGMSLESGSGREKWVRPVEEIVTLGTMLGIELAKQSVMTPTQARKAGIPSDVVAAYAERGSGEVKLVETDMRKIGHIFRLGGVK